MKKVPKVVLTKRDQDILLFIFEQKIVAFEQIHSKFFQNVSRNRSLTRLNKLWKSGHLLKINKYTPQNKPITMYEVQSKGIKAIKEYRSCKNKVLGIKSDSPFHDCVLAQLRIKLENCNEIVEYYTENGIKYLEYGEKESDLAPFIKLRSDGILKIKGIHQTYLFAFEYERSKKSLERYHQKLLQYYFEKGISVVLYVCNNDHIKNLIVEADKMICDKFDSKIFIINEKEFLSSTKKIQFKNLNNTKFELSLA